MFGTAAACGNTPLGRLGPLPPRDRCGDTDGLMEGTSMLDLPQLTEFLGRFTRTAFRIEILHSCRGKRRR